MKKKISLIIFTMVILLCSCNNKKDNDIKMENFNDTINDTISEGNNDNGSDFYIYSQVYKEKFDSNTNRYREVVAGIEKYSYDYEVEPKIKLRYEFMIYLKTEEENIDSVLVAFLDDELINCKVDGIEGMVHKIASINGENNSVNIEIDYLNPHKEESALRFVIAPMAIVGEDNYENIICDTKIDILAKSYTEKQEEDEFYSTTISNEEFESKFDDDDKVNLLYNMQGITKNGYFETSLCGMGKTYLIKDFQLISGFKDSYYFKWKNEEESMIAYEINQDLDLNGVFAISYIIDNGNVNFYKSNLVRFD